MTAPNRNLFWAQTFVDELARCGIEHAVIAPGSRSTPLVMAFAQNPHFTIHSIIDERSAAFFALGIGLSTGKPAALVCSSGTATANFYPAIVEARYSAVPMLVLTADRQHELRASGANQTIDQVKLYGDHALWFYDVALPEAEPPAVAVRNLRTLAARAVAIANGLTRGAVHLNFPFRKPLEPTPVETDITDIEPYNAPTPFTIITRGTLHPTTEQVETLHGLLTQSTRGLIICGPRATVSTDALRRLHQATGYPIFADILSNVRAMPEALTSYDTLLMHDPSFDAPDLILHFGAMPASASLEAYLNRIPAPNRVLISADGTWTDAYHRITHLMHADPDTMIDAVCPRIPAPSVDTAWADSLTHAARWAWLTLQDALDAELFDGSAVASAIHSAAQASTERPLHLFLASSLTVRHAEQYANGENIARVYSNRGASGIDGTIASALGVAAAHPEAHVLLVIGDLAFYHDLNSLLAVKRDSISNITIVLMNNDGGGIFRRLPVVEFDPPFTELFLTPHSLDFAPVVRMFGLHYQHPESLAELREQVRAAVITPQPTVIEITTDSQHDLQRRDTINRAVLDILHVTAQNTEQNKD